MKHALTIVGACVACATLALLAATPWQDAKAKEKAGPAPGGPTAEQMAAMKSYATPGPEHKALAEMAGSWLVTSECWMSPSGPSEKGSGTSTMKPVMDGRFIQEDFSGSLPMGPFHGMGLMGFDNGTGHYQHVWVADTGTGMLYSTGDVKGDVVSFHGEMWCPLTKAVRKVRFDVKKLSDTERTLEMYAQDPGQPEFKTMVLQYKRGSQGSR